MELSKAAGELVGKIRDRFLTQYNDPLAKRAQKSLNILCVRLVFCFYADSLGLRMLFQNIFYSTNPGIFEGS